MPAGRFIFLNDLSLSERLDEFQNADTSVANNRFSQEPRMPQNVVVLIGRVLLSIMFIMSGFSKLMDPSGTAQMITGAGWPAP